MSWLERVEKIKDTKNAIQIMGGLFIIKIYSFWKFILNNYLYFYFANGTWMQTRPMLLWENHLMVIRMYHFLTKRTTISSLYSMIPALDLVKTMDLDIRLYGV